MRMAIDPFETVGRALDQVEKPIALGKVVSLNYDGRQMCFTSSLGTRR